jgi:hypothetical protein
MKASELVTKNFIKLLLYGPSGVGKTVLASQFPGPIEYWDFDGKISSSVRYLPTIGKQAQLEQIDVHQFGHLPVKERIPAWEKRTQLIDECIKFKKPFPFKTLVIDSMTTLSDYLMDDYIYRSQLGIKRPMEGVNSMQDYQLYEKHMSRVLVGVLAQDINVVVIAHMDVDKDENTGMIERKPLVKGKALGPKLPMWFEEVYAITAKPDGSRILITQHMHGYLARCQRGLAKEVPANISEILK